MAEGAAATCAITLHLGAHKTATTWVQSRLADSAPYLAELGVACQPLARFREQFTRKLQARPVPPETAAANLKQAREVLAGFLAAAPGRFIASDENLIGNCQEIIRTGQIYPRLPTRMRVLGRTRLGMADRVVLTIRAYASFFPSVYGEAMRWGDFVPFEVVRDRLQLDSGLWLDVIGQLLDVFGPERLRVMRFEQMPDRLADFLSVLCDAPVDPDRLAPSDERREGLSARAIELLEEVARTDGARRPRQVIDQAAQIFPRDAHRPAFMPWTAAEATQLDELYLAHCQRIMKDWPRVMI